MRYCIECGDDLDDETVGRVCWACRQMLNREELVDRLQEYADVHEPLISDTDG